LNNLRFYDGFGDLIAKFGDLLWLIADPYTWVLDFFSGLFFPSPTLW